MINIRTTGILLVCLAIFCGPIGAKAENKSPADYINRFTAGEKVHWLGEIVSGRAYRSPNGGTVIEWLCRYFEMVEPVQSEDILSRKDTKELLIKVKVTPVQHFVVTQGPVSNPLEAIQPIVNNVMKSKNYLVATGVTDKTMVFDGIVAVSIVSTSDYGSTHITPAIGLRLHTVD